MAQSYTPTTDVQKFKPISPFCCAMSEKPDKGDDVAAFGNAVFEIYNCCTSKQMTFLKS